MGGALLAGFESFRAAAEAVVHGAADLALLPIENTTAGSINETYDLLAGGALHVTGEVVSAIEHCLLALPGVALDELRTVISHPQALAQCQAFFTAHPQLRARAELDTAGAARRVAQSGDRTLARDRERGRRATYGLVIVALGDPVGGRQRHAFRRDRAAAPPVPDGSPAKTSLLLALADRPGALGEVLTRFATRGLSLTKLESRPIPNCAVHVPVLHRRARSRGERGVRGRARRARTAHDRAARARHVSGRRARRVSVRAQVPSRYNSGSRAAAPQQAREQYERPRRGERPSTCNRRVA